MTPTPKKKQTQFEKGFAEAMKACGNCTICYGKGYATQLMGGRTRIFPCKCPRGEEFDKLTILVQNRSAEVHVE